MVDNEIILRILLAVGDYRHLSKHHNYCLECCAYTGKMSAEIRDLLQAKKSDTSLPARKWNLQSQSN